MKRRTKKAAQRAHRRATREKQMANPGGASRYARKRAYCVKHGVWGWEVWPKPWRAA